MKMRMLCIQVAERVSIERLIQLTGELLKGLEQRSFISEQEIMNILAHWLH